LMCLTHMYTNLSMVEDHCGSIPLFHFNHVAIEKLFMLFAEIAFVMSHVNLKILDIKIIIIKTRVGKLRLG